MTAPGEIAGVARLPFWAELNRQWLVAAIARLAQRIEAFAAGGGEHPAAIADAVEPASGFTPALAHCAQVFGLTPFERELLLLVAGLELDNRLNAAVTAANGGSGRASFQLALSVLVAPHWDALSPDAALRHWLMVEPEPGPFPTRADLRIDERILHYLSGIAASDARLLGLAARLPAPAPAETPDPALAEQVARLVAAPDPVGPAILLAGSAADASDRREAALAGLGRAGLPALWLSARDLPADAEAQALAARRIDREAALTGAVPVLSVAAGADPASTAAFAARLTRPLLWLGPADAGLRAALCDRRVLRLDPAPPDAATTRRMLAARWRRLEGGTGDDATAAALDRAAAQFHLDAAARDTMMDRLAATPPAERAAAVWPAARMAARDGLDALAQRIESRVEFDDLVLPAGQIATLRDIARHLRHRETVYRTWGFGAKHKLGQGLVALFSGESGTGKTLAAEAIANSVALDLFRVDLALLVSKYIGETEKNLRQLFDAAEASGAVLLFDEADALFGKRSVVKDSHDRYANIEIAYLLQRVEAYRGLAVLTTNMKSALDRAFLRRIRFVVNFPFPDAAAREQIWRRQFPPEAPLGEIDFTALARLNLSGGNIRSTAVSAAFKAADAGQAIDQKLLMAAAREEFAKLERPLSDAGPRSVT